MIRDDQLIHQHNRNCTYEIGHDCVLVCILCSRLRIKEPIRSFRLLKSIMWPVTIIKSELFLFSISLLNLGTINIQTLISFMTYRIRDVGVSTFIHPNDTLGILFFFSTVERPHTHRYLYTGHALTFPLIKLIYINFGHFHHYYRGGLGFRV